MIYNLHIFSLENIQSLNCILKCKPLLSLRIIKSQIHHRAHPPSVISKGTGSHTWKISDNFSLFSGVIITYTSGQSFSRNVADVMAVLFSSSISANRFFTGQFTGQVRSSPSLETRRSRSSPETTTGCEVATNFGWCMFGVWENCSLVSSLISAYNSGHTICM